MGDIVRYHNDLNKVRIPNISELEQNLLMLILVEIKNTRAGDIKELDVRTLQKAFENDFKNNTEIGKYLLSLRDSFFKADFQRIVIDRENLVKLETINLFSKFALVYDEPKDKPKEEWTNFVGLELSVNPEFEYIINELTANFTAFELAEFVGLSGKYTKTLYRLLKQFRSTGRAYFEWEHFKEIMDMPASYAMRDIEKRILKPALKELTKERTLFDQTRIPFEKLSYEKKKGNGRGRGGNVIGIEFTFKPENIITQENQNLMKITKAENINKALHNLINQRWIYKDDILQVVSIDGLSVVNNVFERDENENLVCVGSRTINFKDAEQLIKAISSNLY